MIVLLSACPCVLRKFCFALAGSRVVSDYTDFCAIREDIVHACAGMYLVSPMDD